VLAVAFAAKHRQQLHRRQLLLQAMQQSWVPAYKYIQSSFVTVCHMTPNQGQLSGAVQRADSQLAYIESCSSPLPSLSSLLSLVSSISAIYKADYSAFCTCRHIVLPRAYDA
jgi:hypothetical protein